MILTEYEITDEPIEDRVYKRLPAEVKEAVQRLHKLARTRPHAAIPELLDLMEQYPDVPIFYNYLSAAYSRAGERKKMAEVIRENYDRNPDYLFARVNYAELCILQGELEKVPAIFDHKFDLKLLYPRRNRFHISEVASFMGVIGRYFYEMGEREMAEQYYELLRQLDPGHPFTRLLKRKLYPSLLLRLLNRLRRR